jgi:hypothetical protein
VAFYNQRDGAEHWIKEGKNPVAWTRLSYRRFAANSVRLQLHVLAYNLSNFLRTLALPAEVSQWSLTTLRDRLVKIGARIHHLPDGRGLVPRGLFEKILSAIAELRPMAARAMLNAPAMPGAVANPQQTFALMVACISARMRRTGRPCGESEAAP